jgi:Putative bacterial sensory transduction regulator
MIKRYLEQADFTYLRDGRNDFRVDFAHDDDISCAPSFWFMAVGRQEEIYGIEGRSTRRFPREMWEWTLFIVNEWNRKMRYPKAYFHVSDAENDRTGEIRLEQYFDLEKGIHQDLFDALSHTAVSGSMRFWSWLNDQFAQYTLMASADEDRLDG